MKADNRKKTTSAGMTRRRFVQTGAMGGMALMAGMRSAPAIVRRAQAGELPNFLFIISDQLGLDALSAHGCSYVNTPNMDRLVETGVSFLQSHTTDPVCSPARSSMFTSRMPSETHVTTNGLPIRSDIPTMGKLLQPRGYETMYIGKYHLPESFSVSMPYFDVIPAGHGGQGHIGDAAVSRACEGFLRNRARTSPFLLIASFTQPHDICQYVAQHRDSPDVLPYPEVAPEFPPMPDNFGYDPNEPTKVKNINRPVWTEQQWRWYLWNYYRHVEMVDREIGRVLQTLDDFGYADNTMIVFTADHGEGRGRHHMVLKNYPYDEAVKVPLVVSWPGRVLQSVQDMTHLVSGLDIAPTICDYAGWQAPRQAKGRSLRPLLEGTPATWRDFVAVEVQVTGRVIRTPGFKYVTFTGDPVEQLFNMVDDPGETVNLAGQPAYDATLQNHRDLLAQWEASLELEPRGASGVRSWGWY